MHAFATRPAPLRLLLAALVAVFLPAAAHAQALGTVTGRVTEKGGKVPIPFVSILLVEVRRGTESDNDGSFTIRDVPAGAYVLRVQDLSHGKVARTVQVNAGGTTSVTVEMGEARSVQTVPEMVIRATRTIDIKTSQNVATIPGRVFEDVPVDDIMKAVGTKRGVVEQGGELHIRGGREGELKVRIDGVDVTDPLVGQIPGLANLMIEGANLITGGIEAQYGDALSGVLEIETREGRSRLAGEAQWHTDRYGESVKTFDNYDRLTFGFGGPTPVRGLTYYGTFEGTWQDTYLKSSRSASRHSFLDFIQLGNRQSNVLNRGLKLAYTREPWKWTFEAIDNRSIRTPYNQMWSRQGFVSVTYDTSAAGSSPAPRYGRWSFFPEDSTYQAYNGPDHLPTTESSFRQFKSVWRHNLSKNDVYTIRLARNEFRDHTAVAGKEPWEYDTRSPFYWSGNEDDNSFYVTHGDYPLWSDRRTVVYSTRGDYVTTRWKAHLIKTGLEARYNQFRNLSLLFPNQETRGLPGVLRSDFVNDNPEGSAYAQDRWEYEGLVLNAGLRFDAFSPGDRISAQDLRDPQTGQPGRRLKQQVSPRLGIAYPISTRDVLSFHYGWLYQIPNRDFLFENRGSQSNVAVRGNPNLEPQTNIEYQAAIQHLFARDVSGQFAVFFRDIFGLIDTRQVRDELTNLLVPVYVNEDYASSRGFEASLVKSFSHKFSGEVNYTYSIATGVASNPNQGLQFANGSLLYLPISEQTLAWDQRHTLSASMVIRDPSKWGVNLLWTYGSGLPYTPAFRNDRKPDPRLENSRRQPSQSTLSIVADKFFRMWGQRVTFFADARNVLNAKNLSQLSLGAFPNPFVNQVGDEYLIYYTETGRAGGAYLKDTNGDGVDEWVPVKDPRVWQEGRSIRVGVGVKFGAQGGD